MIALVITIIVLLILAAVSIATLTGDNGLITKAVEAKFKTEMTAIKEQLDLFKIEKIAENGEFSEDSLTAGEELLEYNTKEVGETGNIYSIFTNIEDRHKGNLEVIKGVLYYATKDKQEIKWLQEIGIEPNPYDIVDGELLSSYGNLLLLDENGTLTIPASVTKIGEGAFANLEGLKTIIIPGTCKEISKNAFANNSTLENVIMQEGVEKIGAEAFKNCTNLKNVQMANSVKIIESGAFMQDGNIEKINVSSGLKTINSYVFSGCRSLEKIVLPEGIESLGPASISSCSKLKYINIPKSMKTIHGTAFYGDSALTTIEVDEENTNFEFKDGILLANNKQEMCIILESSITSNVFTVPEGVTKLAPQQLEQFSQINTVIIPSTVTAMPALFFDSNITKVSIDTENQNYETDGKAVYTKGKERLIRYYSNDSIVTLSNETHYIDAYAFRKETDLTKINLPDTLKSIGEQAFGGCNMLTELTLGEEVNNFNNMSIYGSSIEKVIIDENNPNYSIINGALYNKDGTTFISPIKKQGNITTYEIPNGVKKIESYAFHNQNNMTSIILPNTLEIIGNSFNYCTKLTKIEIPSSVTEIDSSCFSNCGNNLREIIIHKPKGTLSGSPWGCVYGDKAITWQE